MSGKISIVVGGNWGSEAKGTFIGHFVKEKHIDCAVRTGAINAGHTVYYKGKPHAMQQLPVAWVSSNTHLIVGRGAYVSPIDLIREVRLLKTVLGKVPPIFIDSNAGLHLPRHNKAEEKKQLHERMGSTAHGCMEAQIARMRRSANYQSFGQFWAKFILTNPEFEDTLSVCDTVELLNEAYDQGNHILLEGTQGTQLDFLHGQYPYVTSRSTISSHWLTETGLAPTLDIDTYMICRTYPIRVAGNSGPMGTEISWSSFARHYNGKCAQVGIPAPIRVNTLDRWDRNEKDASADLGLPRLPHLLSDKERLQYSNELSQIHKDALKRVTSDEQELRRVFEITTVTRKLRRIAMNDWSYLKRAVMLNRPRWLVVNFLNYEFPAVTQCTTLVELKRLTQWSEIKKYLDQWVEYTRVPISHVGVSPEITINVSSLYA